MTDQQPDDLPTRLKDNVIFYDAAYDAIYDAELAEYVKDTMLEAASYIEDMEPTIARFREAALSSEKRAVKLSRELAGAEGLIILLQDVLKRLNTYVKRLRTHSKEGQS